MRPRPPLPVLFRAKFSPIEPHVALQDRPHADEAPPATASSGSREVPADPQEAVGERRDVIAQAHAAAERIERTLGQAGASPVQPSKVLTQLQERLQLSAQMLKAFQTQITRIEMSLAELKSQEKKAQVAESRAQQRLTDMDARLAAAEQRFKARLDALAQEAWQSLERRMAERITATSSSSLEHADNRMSNDLASLASAIQEFALRLADIAAPRAADSSKSPSLSAEPAACEPAPEPPAAQVVLGPSLRFQSWAGTA